MKLQSPGVPQQVFPFEVRISAKHFIYVGGAWILKMDTLTYCIGMAKNLLNKKSKSYQRVLK